ncbi:GNAT family N-acetyltransferase [Maribacter algarum]|uniref:GNAT family N-acetyltransferase n=1 Tax=Maribacter algarum (ex Zhang et al. 2020) TaxID=2578118 RepID=A0A5S3PW42_9FLAO|nr:GNAT family N-acetyltransferase [Maribacter algarum]TMM59118.1 GNAT family N-acetyltransferase [Maribacter algarum]
MIRRAKISEIPDILTICKACAAHMISNGIYQWNEHYPSAAAFEKDIERDELYVLEVNEKIIGTIVISTLMDDEYVPIEWRTPNGNSVYIHRLSIEPNLQGKGYAQKLMDFAENYAKENGFVSVRLDTFSQNKRNQKFYEARGYRRLGDIFLPKQSEHPFHCFELVL